MGQIDARGESEANAARYGQGERKCQTAKKQSLTEQADNPTAIGAVITEGCCRYLHGFEVLELGKYDLRPVQRPPLFPAAAAILEVTL